MLLKTSTVVQQRQVRSNLFPIAFCFEGKKFLDKGIGVMVLSLLLGRATKLFSSFGNKNWFDSRVTVAELISAARLKLPSIA